MKRAYERHEAERLRPLLESIAREIAERNERVHVLNRSLRRLQGPADDVRAANVVAELAQHKFELRRAHEELATLGCELDPTEFGLVHVPGPDGRLATGYELRLDEAAEPLSPTGTA